MHGLPRRYLRRMISAKARTTARGGGVVMSTKRLSSVAAALLLLVGGVPLAYADGVCTRRPPTAAETTAYTAMVQRQQAQAAANKAPIDAIDAKVRVVTAKVQEAAAAQRFGDIEALNQQLDALTQQRMKLAGYDQVEAESEQVEAEHSRDTEASFQLWFEAPRNEPRSGQPYRTSAGQAFLSAYDDKGNPRHDVQVYFAGAPEQARVQVTGTPERVRALLDAADLKAIAAFK